MKAIRFTGDGGTKTVYAPRPEPGDFEVRIRLEGCGVCASNLPVWEGREWFDYPREPGEPGHEGWGVVDATGARVTQLRAGDRVAAMSYRAFAEYDLARADAVVKLPEALDGQPFPGEPLACAVNIIRRCEIEPGQTVTIIGTGFLGALLTGLATDAGAHVIAVSRRPYSLEVARQFGARETLPLGDHADIVGQVREITGDGLSDCVIEVTGKQDPLHLAGKVTAERGRLVVAGFHQDGSRTVDMQLWNWRGIDVINAHERDPRFYARGLREAVQLVAGGRLDPRPLYTHRVGLDGLSKAFRLMKERPEGFVKALVQL